MQILMENPILWVSLIVIATAVQPMLVKLGYRVSLSAAQLLLVKNFLSALVVLPFLGSFRWISWREFWQIGRISVLILGINGFSLLALERLPAAIVVTLTTTVPLFVALANSLLGREKLRKQFWLGLFMGFVGVLLVTQIFWVFWSGKTLNANFWGMLACLAAVGCATTYRANMQVLTHKFETKLLWIWAFWINFLAVSAVLVPCTPLPSQAEWPLALGVGLSAAIANSAFIWSIRLVGATRTSVFQLLQRPVIILTCAFILGESLSLWQWIGVILVSLGVWNAQRGTEKLV